MNKLLPKTFLWMFIGLLVTFATGFVVATNETMLDAIFSNSLYWIFAIIEIGLVIFLSARIYKMSAMSARICFILYSFVSGLTFSSIFVLFDLTSILMVFLIAAFLFGLFGVIGYCTNLDLGKISTFLLMGLIGIVIATIINIFLKNSTFDLIISIIAVLIFIGYTAYDIQRIKLLSDSDMNKDVLAIHGALELYLDFINIFIHLLSILGDAKNN